MKVRSLVNLGWLVLVNILWASQFPAYRLAADSMSVSALSFYTFVVAIVILCPFLIRERRRESATIAMPAPSAYSLAGSFLLLGVLGLLPPSILMSWGIEHSSGSNAAILTLTVPILMVAVAVPLLGERFTWLRVVTLLLALFGAACISRNDLAGGSFHSSTLAGNAAIVAACAGSAFYNVYSRKLLHRYTGLEVLIYGYAVAAILCAGASIYLDERPFYDMTAFPPAAWAAVFVLGSLTWGISMVLFMWLLKFVDIAQISVSIYLLSFFGVLLSAITLGERIQAVQIVGALVVIAAALLSNSYERRAARPTGAAST
jgi:drug/metabolite transporter (DMT)-like permease